MCLAICRSFFLCCLRELQCSKTFSIVVQHGVEDCYPTLVSLLSSRCAVCNAISILSNMIFSLGQPVQHLCNWPLSYCHRCDMVLLSCQCHRSIGVMMLSSSASLVLLWSHTFASHRQSLSLHGHIVPSSNTLCNPEKGDSY